jgi:hypothetical protein
MKEMYLMSSWIIILINKIKMKIIKITNNNQIKNKNKIKTAILKKDLKI